MDGEIHHAILKQEPCTMPDKLWRGIPGAIQGMWQKFGPNHVYTFSTIERDGYIEKTIQMVVTEEGENVVMLDSNGFIFLD